MDIRNESSCKRVVMVIQLVNITLDVIYVEMGIQNIQKPTASNNCNQEGGQSGAMTKM